MGMLSSKSISFEVICICFIAFIPWPIPPGSVTLQCSRENSRIVRKLVQSKLTPIYQKYHVELPLECPFHPDRDLFSPQENAKIKHKSFTCKFCGKSFFEEKFLEAHFDNRHYDKFNHAEDAICLSDYCDIMRCDVLVAKDSSLVSFSHLQASTDIELYDEATALAAARREFIKSQMKSSSKSFNLPPSLRNKLNDILAATGHKIEPPTQKEKIHKRKRNICNEKGLKNRPINKNGSKLEDETSNEEENAAPCETLADRKQQRISEMQRLKANCKSEEIHKLRNRCELMIRTCIAGALVKLSTEDFKSMEDEMNKAICWYLTCDRYWEDTSSQRPFPWALMFIFVVVLSLGICLCYYIIYVLFDSDESLTPGLFNDSYNLLTAHTSQSPMGSMQMQLQTTAITTSTSMNNMYPSIIQTAPGTSGLVQSQSHTQPLEQLAYTEEFLPTAGIDEQYIYVTYPSEVKKRSSDSFYNRTSRI